jgi:hypothetical protein
VGVFVVARNRQGSRQVERAKNLRKHITDSGLPGSFDNMSALTLTVIIALLIQGYAGATLRGVYADGAWWVNQILEYKGFVLHPHRRLSCLIDQFPVVAAIYAGVDTPHGAALTFSLATNILPGLLILLCLPALPTAERPFFIFPAFVYFAGTLSAQFASEAENLVAVSYFWLLLCLVAFGRPTILRLTIVALLAVGSLWLSEQMLFLGPILLVACGMRWRHERELLPRIMLSIAGLCGLASAALAAYHLLHWQVHYAPGLLNADASDPGSFIAEFLALHWLYTPDGGDGLNLPSMLGILAALCILTSVLRPAWGSTPIWTFAGLSVPLTLASFWFDWLTAPPAQFAARDNPALISLPIAALMLVARVHPRLATAMTKGPVREIVVLLGLTVSLVHVSATEKWSAYLTHFSNVLQSRTGVIPWYAVAAPPESRQAGLASMMLWHWAIPDLSLVAVPRSCVYSVINYPQGWVGWRPHTLSNIMTMPRIPGLIYTYLLPPDVQRTACLALNENPPGPSVPGVSFVVDPATWGDCDPLTVAKVSWNVAVPGIEKVDVFVIDENGREKLWAGWNEVVGSADTGAWLGSGTAFVLRDADSRKELAKIYVGSKLDSKSCN